jgi:toxin ParE1/3/4
VTDYRLTARAENDLMDIFLYGIEQFGLNQAKLYKNDMAHCFQRLAINPCIGRTAPTLGEGVRRHEHKSHVILYEIVETRILILAVVHGRSVRRLEI